MLHSIAKVQQCIISIELFITSRSQSLPALSIAPIRNLNVGCCLLLTKMYPFRSSQRVILITVNVCDASKIFQKDSDATEHF